jgi:hypothetical protein
MLFSPYPYYFGTIRIFQYRYYLILIDTGWSVPWNVPGWNITKPGRNGPRRMGKDTTRLD